MTSDRIASLLDKASEHYNQGRYDEAMALWREVLSVDPANQKAQEGIRMASLLTEVWPAAPPQAVEDADDGVPVEDPSAVGKRIEAGMARVRELTAAGQFAEALEGCDLLAEIAPDLETVRKLAREVRQAADSAAGPPGGGIETHLQSAREALAAGRNREAAEHAKRVLEIDPGNIEACGILSMSADDELAASPVPIDTTEPGGATKEFETGPYGVAQPADGHAKQAQDPGVADLIARGHAALAEGRPEAAIEIWSRVFALDRGNSEAGILIDKARAAIDEQSRHVDEVFYRAVDANDAGRKEEAIGLFEQVLTIAPNHVEARAALEEALRGPAAAPGDEPADAGVSIQRKRRAGGAAGAGSVDDLLAPITTVPLAEPRPGGLHSSRMTPIANRESTARPALLASPKRGGGVGRFLGVVVGVLAVAGAGLGAWLWFGEESGAIREAAATVLSGQAETHPTAGADPTAGANPPAGAHPAAGANPAAGTRPTAGARTPSGSAAPGALNVVPGGAQPPAPAPEANQAATAEEIKAEAAELRREGHSHYQEGRWAESVLAYRKALASDPLSFDAQDELEKGMAQLQKQANLESELTQATRYFGEQDYASALTKFYRLQQDHPEMKIVETYIKNSWYNWGVTLLQAGAVDEAVEKFDEVLLIDAQDSQASRAREISKRYHGRKRDTVYEATVKPLALRTLDRR